MGSVDRRRAWSREDVVFLVGAAASSILLVWVGSHQWFTRDDWMFVLTRELQRGQGGGGWLFEPQNGHFMAAPIAAWAAIKAVFGLGSYWPFLLPTIALHVGAVALVREHARRAGAESWATAGVCGVLLVFGSGWENLAFAVQITFNLSLVGFLAQLLLVDHLRPVGRRDVAGACCGVVSVASSGYGLVLVAGIGAFLALRRRWAAALAAVTPAVALYALWYLTYGVDDPAAGDSGGVLDVLRFFGATVFTTASSLVGAPGLAIPLGLVVVGAVAYGARLESGGGERMSRHSAAVASVAVGIVAALAVASQRAGVGQAGEAARYVYMTAVMAGPLVAVSASNLSLRRRRFAPVLAVVLVGSIVLNSVELENRASRWGDDARAEREVLEALAGWDRLALVHPDVQPLAPASPDVFVRHLPLLVEWDAVDPRPPASLNELAVLERLLPEAPPAGET